MCTIDKVFLKHKCRTCEHLTYWDGYFCKLGKHQTKSGFLNKKSLKSCDGYIKRQGDNYEKCKNQECVFWCNECPAYPDNKENNNS